MMRQKSTAIGWLMGLLIVALLVPPPVFAWGPRGHRLAAKIAMERLTPKAKQGIAELLNKGDTLADIADWADHQGHDVEPNSAPWHYVNVPITADRYSEKYCNDRGCVVTKIKQYRRVLANQNATKRERQLALLFLVHFVEDIHQPLHVGDNKDRGGNNTQIQFFNNGSNMHRLWDSDIIEHERMSDGRWLERITPMLTPANVAAWSKGTVEDWATESLNAAKQAYDFPKGSNQPLQTGSLLGEEYMKFADPIVRDRLARAGVRLANELNAIFH
jgi:hypothetical protein